MILISSQELPLTVMIANRLRNFAFAGRDFTKFYLPLLELVAGIEPATSNLQGLRSAYWATPAYVGVGRHPRTNLYTESAYRRSPVAIDE